MTVPNGRTRVREEEPLATTTPTMNPKFFHSMTQTMLEGHINPTEKQIFNPPKEKPKRKKNYEARKTRRKEKKDSRQSTEDSQESDLYEEHESDGEVAIIGPGDNESSAVTLAHTIVDSSSSDNHSTPSVAGQTDTLHNRLINELRQTGAHSSGDLELLSNRLQGHITLLRDRRDLCEHLNEYVERLRQCMLEENGGGRSEGEEMLLSKIGILTARLAVAI